YLQSAAIQDPRRRSYGYMPTYPMVRVKHVPATPASLPVMIVDAPEQDTLYLPYADCLSMDTNRRNAAMAMLDKMPSRGGVWHLAELWYELDASYFTLS